MNRENYMNNAGDLDLELRSVNNISNEYLSSDNLEVFSTADTPLLSIFCC